MSCDLYLTIVNVSSNSWESEGFDREHMKLPGLSDRLVSEVLKANPNTIVVNQSGTPVEMPWESEAHTLLQVRFSSDVSPRAYCSPNCTRHSMVVTNLAMVLPTFSLARSTLQPSSRSPSRM